MNRTVGWAIAGLVILSILPSARAGWKDEIGYTQLAEILGINLPTGSGIRASHIEAETGENKDYAPLTTHDQFAGKTFTLMSGTTGGVSGHATSVGRLFYGLTESISPGVDTIHNWAAGSWTSSGFLKTGSSSEPAIEVQDVQNHSWIGSFESISSSIEALRRFDYTINRDNYVAVVGVNNGSSTSIPQLLAHCYNAISVGCTDGDHSHGLTTFDGFGRIKPDIVAPQSTTSMATPMVGSAAALLLEAGAGTQAENSETIKAILLAGATKHEFSDWDRTSTRPLDDIYGAGELNIHRSFNILEAGEQEASATEMVTHLGWDFNIGQSNDLCYFFEVSENDIIHEMSVTLTWNRTITDGISGTNWGNPISSLADLSLELWQATDFSLDTQLDLSNSPVDNVEHIYIEHLTAGQYAMRVLGAEGTDFALAWSGTDYSIMGDINLDGFVNGDGTGPLESDDLSAFIAGWGQTHALPNMEAWKLGDLNLDGITDLWDFSLLRSAHSGAGAIASRLSIGAIPEPGTAWLVALTGLGLVGGWFRIHPARPR
ncbi:MAG: hypothetical protein JW829_15720 [Pirellulales bacterium]|nr:hypothetical protein [Pirellulales bacterium]